MNFKILTQPVRVFLNQRLSLLPQVLPPQILGALNIFLSVRLLHMLFLMSETLFVADAYYYYYLYFMSHPFSPAGFSVTVPDCSSEVKLLNRVRLFASPWTVARQAPLSMGFLRQGYWSGLPLPSPEDLPDPGIETGSPAL